MSTYTTTVGGERVTVHVDSGLRHMPADGVLGLDVESTYLTDRAQFDPKFRVRTVQFATEDTAWVLDANDPSSRRQIESILRAPGYSFCSHTNMDVLSVWVEFGIDIADRNIDTRALAIMADPDKDNDRDLKTLAGLYGMGELKDDDDELYAWMVERWVAMGGRKNAARSAIEESGWNAFAEGVDDLPDVFFVYAGKDAIVCRRLLPLLIPATQAPAELLRIEQWLAAQANRIQMRGLRVDENELNALLLQARRITEGAEKYAKETTGGITLRSPKLHDWFAEHGVDWDDWPGARTPKGAPSLAKENAKLIGDYPLDIAGRAVFDSLMTFRGSLDLLNKCEGIAARIVDGRIHPLLNPVGATTTARMSSSGPNLQNMSKRDRRMRGMFLPDPGHELWTIDFDQVELRVVAGLAREQKMIDTILAGGDLHQLTVDELATMGVEITRQVGKMANFLIVYGGGGKALAEQANIPLDVATEVVYGIRERYPSINALSQYMGMRRDEIRTISGRRLPVTRVKGSSSRAGDLRTYANVNYLVQSSARELLVDAWHRFAVDFGHDGVVWWPVHDELVLHVPVGESDQIIADAERAMTLDFMGVPITASAIKLVDEQNVSRWMPGDIAEKIAKGAI
jgi:DNA polymerase-1